MKCKNRLHFLRKCTMITSVSIGLVGILNGAAPAVFADTVAPAAAANTTPGSTTSDSSNATADSSSTSSGTVNSTGTIDTSQLSQDEQKILEVFQYISQYHVEKISEDTLMQGAIDGMLQATGDPYTTYFSDQEYQQFVDSLDQKFVGIGIYLKQDGTDFVIDDVVNGGPAEQAGLHAGDIIYTVDGQNVQGKSMDDVRNLLLGKEGTKATVSIKRSGQDQPVTYSITRAQLQLPTVVSKLTPEQLGYIQMADFSETAADEFTKALKDLEGKGAKGFIIDLRGNPGGLLEQAVQIADQFVKSGDLLKTVESDGGSQTYTADGKGIAFTQPVVILVDENSASAAEALSGSLQALRRATLIGTRTFGKGTMQVGIPLATGGVLKLTIGKYYLPDGSNPNQTGVKPDITIQNPDLQYNEAVQLLDSTRKQTLRYSSASAQVQLNGVDVQAPQLFKSHGTVYVPLRYTLESFGWQVTWDADTHAITSGTATANHDAVNQQRVITNTAYTAQGQTHTLQHPLLLQDGMTYISLNDFQTVFPLTVQTTGQTVTVTQP